MIEDLETIEKAVITLNAEFFEAIGEAWKRAEPFMMISTGNQQLVTFLDSVVLWDSENEERETVGDGEDYEPLIDFVKREATNCIEMLYKFIRL